MTTRPAKQYLGCGSNSICLNDDTELILSPRGRVYSDLFRYIGTTKTKISGLHQKIL